MVKNLPATEEPQETQVQPLGWEDLLEKGKGYPLQHSGLENCMDCISPWGHKELDMTEQLSFSLSCPYYQSVNVVLQHTRGFPGGSVVKNLPANAGDAG